MTSRSVEFCKKFENVWQVQFGYSSRKLGADENHSVVAETLDEC